MDSITILRASLLAGAVIILFVKSVPSLSNRFLPYGSRGNGHGQPQNNQSNHLIVSGINALATVRIPHSWFTSFYVVSTFCSLLWASEVVFKGTLFQIIAKSAGSKGPSMTLDQVTITWVLMLSQGLRRLYECLTLTKPSSARMWIGHWAFGVWYYISINVAVWIEGSSVLLKESYQPQHFSFRAPSLRSFVSIFIFLLASGAQHDTHAYLAGLKKYTLPDHPIFHNLVCPHYFAECLIYLALSIIAAPPGYHFNHTIFCALVLVAVNLGVTADGTKRWYEQKFGIESVKNRWRMIPFVF